MVPRLTIPAESVPEMKGIVSEIDLIINNLREAKSDAKYNSDSLDYAMFAARRARFIPQRLLAVTAAQSAENQEEVVKGLESLKKEASDLKLEYERLWDRESRVYAREGNVKKYSDFINTLPKK